MKPQRPGWIGHPGPTGRNCRWTHPAYPGIEVAHCGHPTANWPYYVIGIEHLDRTFRRLAEAQAVVECIWICHAHPAERGGKPCGHTNAGGDYCTGCGCTKIASDLRLAAKLSKQSTKPQQEIPL